MSKTTDEMKVHVQRAEEGDLEAMERIRTYLEQQAFPLFGEDMWPEEERKHVLESDARVIETMQIIIEHIEEAGTS